MEKDKEQKIWVKGGHYVDAEAYPKAKCKVVSFVPAKAGARSR